MQYFHRETCSYIFIGQPFVIGDVQYPSNWLELATDDEITDLGLSKVITVGERKDSRYYDNVESLEGKSLTITAIAKDSSAIKSIRWEEVKSVRDRLKNGGFKVNIDGCEKWFHSDVDSRVQHLGLKDMARDHLASGGLKDDVLTIRRQPVRWKTMDGSFVAVSAKTAFDIVAAACDLDANIFVVAEMHKSALQASADPASYDFSGGWPKVFGE